MELRRAPSPSLTFGQLQRRTTRKTISRIGYSRRTTMSLPHRRLSAPQYTSTNEETTIITHPMTEEITRITLAPEVRLLHLEAVPGNRASVPTTAEQSSEARQRVLERLGLRVRWATREACHPVGVDMAPGHHPQFLEENRWRERIVMEEAEVMATVEVPEETELQNLCDAVLRGQQRRRQQRRVGPVQRIMIPRRRRITAETARRIIIIITTIPTISIDSSVATFEGRRRSMTLAATKDLRWPLPHPSTTKHPHRFWRPVQRVGVAVEQTPDAVNTIRDPRAARGAPASLHRKLAEAHPVRAVTDRYLHHKSLNHRLLHTGVKLRAYVRSLVLEECCSRLSPRQVLL